MLKVGDILGDKYVLTRLIGKGGMGVVYEAEHRELGKKVAIKVPNEVLAQDARGLERFKREPKTAATTGHAGIIDVYDIGTCEDGLPYVVMELLDGQSLSHLVAKEGDLELEYGVYIAAQVLAALDAAHSKKIIHRDLKPDNVFLVEEGKALPAVKLLDFGTSKVVGGDPSEKKLTDSGAILGTPFYMAPEQITKEAELDKRVDVYAVGILLYEMLTGKLPFVSDNVYSLVHAVLEGKFLAPRELREEIDVELEAIVMRAMSRDRDERFRSAASMLQALLPHLNQLAKSRISLPNGLRPSGPESRDEEDTIPAETLPDAHQPLPGKATNSGRRSIMVVLLGVVVVSVVVVGSLFGVGPSTEPVDDAAVEESIPATKVEEASLEPPTNSDPDPAPSEPEQTPLPELVSLTFTNVPDGAVVFLDGARLRKRTVNFRPSNEARRFKVRLSDGQEHAEMITIQEEASIDVGGLVASIERPSKGKKISSTKRPSKRRPSKTSDAPAESDPADSASHDSTQGHGEGSTKTSGVRNPFPWQDTTPVGTKND